MDLIKSIELKIREKKKRRREIIIQKNYKDK